MICKCLSKSHKARQVKGHVFLETTDAKRTWQYFGFRTLFMLQKKKKEKNIIHAWPLTEINIPKPLNPFGNKQVVSQGIADSHDTSVQHRRGSVPRKSGKWLLSCLCLATVTTVLGDPRMPKGGMTAQPRERERAKLSTGRCGVERKARASKTSEFYKSK